MGYEQLVELCDTFSRRERDEFLTYVWSAVFAQWDANGSTEQAIKFANESQDRAEAVWAEYK